MYGIVTGALRAPGGHADLIHQHVPQSVEVPTRVGSQSVLKGAGWLLFCTHSHTFIYVLAYGGS